MYTWNTPPEVYTKRIKQQLVTIIVLQFKENVFFRNYHH